MTRADDAKAAWKLMAQAFLSTELHDRMHAACRAIALPHPGSLKLLLQLDADDPPPMRSVANVLRCDASYVTSLVDTLEAPGYVERRTSPTDRRVKLVALTPAGEKARAEALDILSQPPAGFANLTAEESRQLARLLAKVSNVG